MLRTRLAALVRTTSSAASATLPAPPCVALKQCPASGDCIAPAAVARHLSVVAPCDVHRPAPQRPRRPSRATMATSRGPHRHNSVSHHNVQKHPGPGSPHAHGATGPPVGDHGHTTEEELLRSVLYVPGANERAMAKARTLPCDGIILDLEDAVARSAKDAAREAVVAQFRTAEPSGSTPSSPSSHGVDDSAVSPFSYRTVAVRVNALDSPWGLHDVIAVAGLPIDAVVLPKVEHPAQVYALAAMLKSSGASPATRIWAMIESPLGVLNAHQIAASHWRVSCLVAGTTDLTFELKAAHTPDRTPLHYHLAKTVLAARSAGISVLDGVHLNLGDADEFVAHAQQARDFGFDGKTLIHPKTIEAANITFAPSDAQVQDAIEVTTAFEKATAEGKGVAVVNGRLIEHMHEIQARGVLRAHEEVLRRAALASE